MRNYFSWMIFYTLIISIICVIPEWNLEKSGIDLLADSDHEYVTIYRLMYDVELKMSRKIYKTDNSVNYTNTIYMSYNWVNKITRNVSFDFVESFYIINDNFIVCPKGPYHPYNLNSESYLIPNGFIEPERKNWDLKCYKLNDKYLLIFYFIKGKQNIYYLDMKGTAFEEMPDNYGELYDYKINTQNYYDGKQGNYAMMTLLKREGKLSLRGKVIYFEDDNNKKGQFDAGSSIDICTLKENVQAYFDNYTNSFYYITYNNIYDFISGYVTTQNSEIDIKNFDWAKTINKSETTPFEFIDKEFDIEEMNIMQYNRYVYYKIKVKNDNDKIYHGIIDITKNKVIFNTKDTINYFIPYSSSEMLAITPKTAYKICMYKKDGECVEVCPEEYNYDVYGNTCVPSPTCDKITLIPSGICIDSCDETIYIRKDNKCGLCKDFNPSGNSYKLINGTDCREFDENSMEYYNEDLKLLKCKEGYELIENDCITKEKECFKLCEKNKCTQYSNDENDQHCTSCINEYFLEKGNCKKNCSEGYGISGRECVLCEDDYCDNYLINTCNCIKCKDTFYINGQNKCEKCSDDCKGCFNEENNCTSCNEKQYLTEDNKCNNCSEKCRTCDKGLFEGNDNCLTCDENSAYKYFFNNDTKKTCVENCESIGRQLSEDKTTCVPVSNNTSGNGNEKGNTDGKKGADYILWIFIAIIAIALIVITIIILKKCCFNKDKRDIFSDIPTEEEGYNSRILKDQED